MKMHYEKTIMMSGLLFSCPIDDVDNNCPFISLWSQPIEERLSIIEDLNQVQIVEKVRYHKQCLLEKENIKIRDMQDKLIV